MLVLSRRIGERVLLALPDGAKVWVTVVRVDRGRAYLAFDAPADVRIWREELLSERAKETA